jgi:SAM-dependent methyltransferase
MNDSVDAIYYRHAASLPAVRSIGARARLYRDFMREMRPGPSTRILDIGGSDEEGADANMFEKQYPWPSNIVCVGLGEGKDFQKTYPQVEYKRIKPDDPLPFAHQEFDIVYSNAVLEHVGGASHRMRFVAEARRVGSAIFFSAPNRWFPLEHHTAIPFLHWNSDLFRFVTAKTHLTYWADADHLEFLSRHSLTSLLGRPTDRGP